MTEKEYEELYYKSHREAWDKAFFEQMNKTMQRLESHIVCGDAIKQSTEELWGPKYRLSDDVCKMKKPKIEQQELFKDEREPI